MFHFLSLFIMHNDQFLNKKATSQIYRTNFEILLLANMNLINHTTLNIDTIVSIVQCKIRSASF